MATHAAALPRRRRRAPWSSAFVYALALAVAGVSIVPVVYVVLGGFRTAGQIAANPAGLPNPWVFDTYLRVASAGNFWRLVFNSTVVALGTTLGVVALGVCAAFALSRYRFRGREVIYTYFVLGLLFPAAAGILPLYLLLRDLGLDNTWWGVILPQVAFGLPLTIVILRPFLLAVPGELEDAAMIDGSSKLGFFVRILLPLSRPALVTVGVLSFVSSWNAFLLPLLILNDKALYTLPLGVQQFQGQYSSDTAAILAYTSLSMLPALMFFLLAERQIVGGLTGAIKG
jgi:raffinose/stachyose/melibiose transport system permease protein